MGYLLYQAKKKEKRLLTKSSKKIKLLLNMFTHIIASCILMIIEFVILCSFGVEIRYIILIICLLLIIFTAIFPNIGKN